MVNSKRYPDRAMAWDDTPAFYNSLKQTMGRETLHIDRGAFTSQSSNKKVIVAIDLTKSSADGVAGGEVSFTGENMRSSILSVQQKNCVLTGAAASQRIFLCLRYDAIIEISAGGVDLLL